MVQEVQPRQGNRGVGELAGDPDCKLTIDSIHTVCCRAEHRKKAFIDAVKNTDTSSLATRKKRTERVS